MAKYRVLERSFVNDAIVEVGAVIDYAGTPGPNLEPIDAPAQAAADNAGAANADSILRRAVAAAGGDPTIVPDGLGAKVIAEAKPDADIAAVIQTAAVKLLAGTAVGGVGIVAKPNAAAGAGLI